MALINSERIPMFSVKPTHITFYTEATRERTHNNQESIKSPMPNSTSTGRKLSDKAAKRLKGCINYLVEFSKVKRVYNEKLKKTISFKVNFITLTLPATQAHLDSTIKNKCLNNWLTTMRKNFGMNNYVWRAEAQENGNIHFHIITDQYINYYIVRQVWNRNLALLGYIDKYHNRFKDLSFKDYTSLMFKLGRKDLSSIRSSFNYGVKSNWKDPNTTDIHSVKDVKNLSGYLAKYMSKSAVNSDGKEDYDLKARRIKGRLWGCSQSLSRCKGYQEVVNEEISEIFDFATKVLKCKCIVEEYYQVLCVNLVDLKKRFRAFYDKVVKYIKDSADYVSGTVLQKSYSISG